MNPPITGEKNHPIDPKQLRVQFMNHMHVLPQGQTPRCKGRDKGRPKVIKDRGNVKRESYYPLNGKEEGVA